MVSVTNRWVNNADSHAFKEIESANSLCVKQNCYDKRRYCISRIYCIRYIFRALNLSCRFSVLSLIWVSMGGGILAIFTGVFCIGCGIIVFIVETDWDIYGFFWLSHTNMCQKSCSMILFLCLFNCVRSFSFCIWYGILFLFGTIWVSDKESAKSSKPLMYFHWISNLVMIGLISVWVFVSFECAFCTDESYRKTIVVDNRSGMVIYVFASVFSVLQIPMFYWAESFRQKPTEEQK